MSNENKSETPKLDVQQLCSEFVAVLACLTATREALNDQRFFRGPNAAATVELIDERIASLPVASKMLKDARATEAWGSAASTAEQTNEKKEA